MIKRVVRPRLRLLTVFVPLAFILSGGLVFQASNAAFTATTTNSGNSWSSGTVVLTAAAPFGTAVFTPTGLKPGDTATKCITVTYSGSLTSAAVKLYVTGVTGEYVPVCSDGGILHDSHMNPDCS